MLRFSAAGGGGNLLLLLLPACCYRHEQFIAGGGRGCRELVRNERKRSRQKENIAKTKSARARSQR